MDSDDIETYFPDDENSSFLNLSYSLLNFTDVEYDFSGEENIYKLYILYLVIFAIGLLGNALVIYVILRYRQMRTSSNIYVFNLALGDFLYMLCLLFFALEIYYGYWPWGVHMCKAFWVISTTVAFTSMYFLTVMSVSNSVQVYFPVFFSKKLGPKAAMLISFCVWLHCLLLGIPVYMHSDVDTTACRIIWPEPRSYWAFIFTLYQFIMAFLVPLVIFLVCLILTALSLKADSNQGVGKENVLFLILLALVYFIIWLPLHILEILSTTTIVNLSPLVYYLVSLMPYLKSCIYPIMYAFLSTSFKEIFKNIFCCRKVQGNKDMY